MLEASMVVIGDELLGGYVADANSPWLATQLREHGVPLSRVHVIPDEYDAIDEALQAELRRSQPRLIVTSGGVGSTPDDITFEAIASSLQRDLVIDPTLAQRMDDIIERARADGLPVDDVYTNAVMRMARVPAGSVLLTSERYWVPAVSIAVDGGLDADGVTIVVLPGVPRIFRDVISDIVVPHFVAGRNAVPTVVEITHWFPESTLNRVFGEIVARFADVKLGSYPSSPMLVRLTGPADAVAQAEQLVRAELAALESTDAGARLAEQWRQRRERSDTRGQPPSSTSDRS